ncbi:hypothetical protein pb186bvf_017611 [Paramecium bursaria]
MQNDDYEIMIPIPAQCVACWSFQGQLLSVHNQLTNYQKITKDQHNDLRGRDQIITYVNIKTQTQDNMITRPTQNEPEDYHKDFMKIGMKIITEKNIKDFDYLNYQYQSLELPFIEQSQQSKEKQSELKNQREVNTNQFYYTDLSEDVVFLEQLKTLKTKLERFDKEPQNNQNVSISVYDFSSYTYNSIDQLKQLHKIFKSNLFKSNDYENLINFTLKNFMKSDKSIIYQYFQQLSNQDPEKTTVQMQVLKLLFDNVYKYVKQNIHQMNLVNYYINYEQLQIDNIINMIILNSQCITEINKRANATPLNENIDLEELKQMLQKKQSSISWDIFEPPSTQFNLQPTGRCVSRFKLFTQNTYETKLRVKSYLKVQKFNDIEKFSQFKSNQIPDLYKNIIEILSNQDYVIINKTINLAQELEQFQSQLDIQNVINYYPSFDYEGEKIITYPTCCVCQEQVFFLIIIRSAMRLQQYAQNIMVQYRKNIILSNLFQL